MAEGVGAGSVDDVYELSVALFPSYGITACTLLHTLCIDQSFSIVQIHFQF